MKVLRALLTGLQEKSRRFKRRLGAGFRKARLVVVPCSGAGVMSTSPSYAAMISRMSYVMLGRMT